MDSKDRVARYSDRSIFISKKAISDIERTITITTISLFLIILKANYTIRVFLGYEVKRFRQCSKELAFSLAILSKIYLKELCHGS